MVVDYFDGLKTVQEVKAEYRRLAMKNHPDLGGDVTVMQVINAAYESALKACDGQATVGEDGIERVYKYNPQVEQEIVTKLSELLAMRMEGVDILLIGTWLWVLGNTKPHKEELKKLECQWHSKRGAWYFRTAENRVWRKYEGSLQDIARNYGYVEFKGKKQEDKPRLKA